MRPFLERVRIDTSSDPEEIANNTVSNEDQWIRELEIDEDDTNTDSNKSSQIGSQSPKEKVNEMYSRTNEQVEEISQSLTLVNASASKVKQIRNELNQSSESRLIQDEFTLQADLDMLDTVVERLQFARVRTKYSKYVVEGYNEIKENCNKIDRNLSSIKER